MKEKEYRDLNKNLRNDKKSTVAKKPQIFINELFKLWSAEKISNEDIAEQVNTMIVGVSSLLNV